MENGVRDPTSTEAMSSKSKRDMPTKIARAGLPKLIPARLRDRIGGAIIPSKRVSVENPRSVTPIGKIVPPRVRGHIAVVAKPTAPARGSGFTTFFLFVLLPTICAFIYFAFIQTRQYVSESRFVIRAASEQKATGINDALSALSKLGGSGGAKSTVQDGFIVTDYVRGRTVVADVGGKPYLLDLFAKPEIDFASRLKQDPSVEELWKYWTKHVNATLDTISGVVTLRVNAFSARDALAVNQSVLDLCEKLINAITERSRADSVKRAESEVMGAAQKLAEARQKLLEFRNRNILIDPVEKAKSIGDLIGKLTIKRIEVENNLSVLSGSLTNDSPSQRLMARQLAVIDRQIAELKEQLTGDKSNPRVSAEIGEYEQLKLGELFTQRLYQISQSSYEKARQEASRQQLFLLTVVKPLLPEEPEFPKVSVDTFLFFAILLVIWSIGSLIFASVKDHMEV